MIKKILIANRGEIACRIIRSAKAMNIKTVAVYSDADADALHVQMADEHVNIGPAAAAESYLVIEKIIKAAHDTKSDAIHPGYGFLSENAKFVEAVEAAKITFIGPGTKAILAMGDKIRSKKLAEKAGVNTIPGHTAAIKTPKEAVKIADGIGYPVMIKASAGGGGKGMRVAHKSSEVEESFKSAKHEAKSSFGDDRVFIEKFIEEPRHIEIQVIGDKSGNVIHLGERECSIQRRHQKVIEEAPSPFLDDKTREAMGAQAVALAKAVNYYSAGTVEFIVDKKRNFYFLEMNTRLQVEHPVTELVTGADLVQAMIRIAAGEKLAVAQEDVQMTGWAIEARVYAEDPYRGFLPSIGRLARYVPPDVVMKEDLGKDEVVRVDTGVFEGAEITMFYDPMIAKLITYGATRDDAIATMRRALDAYYIRGIAHNIPFLSAVMGHPRFRKGDLSTGFIEEEYPDGFSGGKVSKDVRRALLAAATFMNAVERFRETRQAGGADADEEPKPSEWRVALNGKQFTTAIRSVGDGALVTIGDGAKGSGDAEPVEVKSDWVPGLSVFDGVIGKERRYIEIDRLALGYRLTTDGVSLDVRVMTARQAEFYALMPKKKAPDTSNLLLCPMPGLVVSLGVEEGDEIKAGQALAVVEAMKMENILRAEKDGKVSKVHAAPGDSLAVDAVIMEFE